MESYLVKVGLKVPSAQMALRMSLDKFGRVDMPYIQATTHLVRRELLEALGDEMYFNPISGEYEEADRWLTGNVTSKLQQARGCIGLYHNGELQEAEHAVNALMAAQTTAIPFYDIDTKFGARWIPVRLYTRFLKDMNTGYFSRVNLHYSPATDEYVGDVYVTNYRWAGCGHTASETVMWALRGSVPTFFMTDAKGKKVADEEKRQRALKIVETICDDWQEWLSRRKQEDVRRELMAIYNAKFNNEVRPKYDGSFQTFPDLRLDNFGYADLYPSQKDAIWMLKRNNGGVCWHEVGTGKTLIMCVASYEMKRIGKVQKPVIIGLKANVAQIADTYHKAYPNAKMYFPSEKEWAKKNLDATIERICNEDWDVVIMTHDQFKNLPRAYQTEIAILCEEYEEMKKTKEECDGQYIFNRQTRVLEKRMEKNLEQRRQIATEFMRSKHQFPDTGIDHIFVDESHMFKNLPFVTRNTRVAGIGNPTGSQRSEHLLTCIRDIQSRKGTDLCATFASGTVVTNSLSELYIVLKYLRPAALKAQNIGTFDSWAMVFCVKKTDYEINIVGQLRSKERYSSYVNLPELSKFVSQITDYRTSDMCGIDVPDAVQHFCSAPPTPNQQTMLNRLVRFVEQGKWHELGIKRDRPANVDKALMLVTTNLAKQTSLDPRMLDDCKTFGDEAGCKVRRCADNIVRLYREHNDNRGTQFVFTDTSTLDASKWNMQQELHDLLVGEYGIPYGEVQIINNYNTDAQRLALFDRMNRGEVRVLIGSTQKLGTGVNAQERAVAIHHLDIPWRPSDMEQRNGRAVRKGNINGKVDVFVYATERTLDAYKFSLLKNKQMFIQQLNNGTLGVRRIDDDMIGGEDDKAVSYAEFLSIVSGNTDLLEKARLDAKILAMEKDRAQFYRDRNEAQNRITAYSDELTTAREWIAKAESDVAAAHDVTADTIPVIMAHADECTDKRAAGKAIAELRDTFMTPVHTTIGECGSLKLSAIRMKPEVGENIGAIRFYIVGKSGQYYGYPYNCGQPYCNDYQHAASYPYETLQDIAVQIANRKARISYLQSQLPSLKDFVAHEWKHTDELVKLKAKLEEVKARINDATKSEAA